MIDDDADPREFTSRLSGIFKTPGNVALSIKRQSSEASLIDDDAVPGFLKMPRSAKEFTSELTD